jgi:hypothetical protein
MITKASAQNRQHVVAPCDRLTRRVPAPHHSGDACDHLNLGQTAQARPKMLERSVQKGIAFAQHHHGFAARQIGQPCGPIIIKRRKPGDIFGAVKGQFGGDRIFHRIFHRIGTQHAGHDLPRHAGAARFAEKGDVARGAHHPDIRSGSPGPSPAQMILPAKGGGMVIPFGWQGR